MLPIYSSISLPIFFKLLCMRMNENRTKKAKKTNQKCTKKNKERNVTKTISTTICCNYFFISATQTEKIHKQNNKPKKICNRYPAVVMYLSTNSKIALNLSTVCVTHRVSDLQSYWSRKKTTCF